MYVSLCDFVSIVLFLPFVLGFCLSVFSCFLFFLFFITFYFFIFNNFFNIFYFNDYFILFFSFSLSFLLPILLSGVADRVSVLWPGVRPVPLRWEI